MQTKTNEQILEGIASAILSASEVLDPNRQGPAWPDPIFWDGRPLVEQAGDLLALLDATIDRDEYPDEKLVELREKIDALRDECLRRGIDRDAPTPEDVIAEAASSREVADAVDMILSCHGIIGESAAKLAMQKAQSLDDLRTILIALGKAISPPVCDYNIDPPTFGGQPPADMTGLWSWDETRLLVGASWSDLSIRPRADYE